MDAAEEMNRAFPFDKYMETHGMTAQMGSPSHEIEQLTALVRIKVQYGQQVIEPVDDVAKEFARIAGTKLLTQPTIESM